MVIFCTNCGTKLDDEDNFCMNCGTKINKVHKKSKDIAKIKREPENMKIKEKKIKENKFESNRLLLVKRIINKSCPECSDIKLASFEKERIESKKLDGDITLKKMAEDIIKTHKKIGRYDFAGQLIEEGGFTNKVDIMDFKKRARKGSDYLSNVFIKIFENNIKIVGSEIVPIYIELSLTPKYKGVVGKDRTIFFNDITGIAHSDEELHLNLSNNEKLILKGKKTAELNEENIESFYKSLNKAWEKFKNKENETPNQINEKNESSVADELMKYGELYEKGLLSEEEFNSMKKKLLDL